MNQRMSLERMLADWMVDETAGGVPDELIDQIVSSTRRTRPLPRWVAVLRTPPMFARSRTVVGMPRRQLAVLAALLLLGIALAVGAAAALLLPPRETASADWPGFRGDARRNGISGLGPSGRPIVEWQFHAGGGVQNAIAISGDLVLAPSDDGVLHAIDVTNGRERWSFPAPAPMKGPFVTGGRVYVADGSGSVHSLVLEDGTELWKRTTPITTTSDLVVDEGRLFVGSGDGLLIALEASTGNELWRRLVSDGQLIHAPAVADGVVVVLADDGTLAAVDAASGRLRWQIAGGDDQVGTPVVVDGVAYVGGGATSLEGRLTAVDLTTAAERWRVDRNIYSPAILGDIGYTGSAVGLATALDLATGSIRWTTAFDGVIRPPAVAGDVVYLSADRERRIVALDRASGLELWSFPVDGGNGCCIAVAHGLVFVGTTAGTVYAIGGDGAAIVPKPVSSSSPAPTSGSTAPATATPRPTVHPLDTSVLWAVDSGASDFVPWGLAEAPDGRFWVAEALSDRFSIFERDGTFVESWGGSGDGDGQFHLLRATYGDPFGMIAFARDGSIYVLDVGNRRVQVFDRARRFVRTWGSFGSDPGKFTDPMSLAVDADGNVNVLDNGRRVVETYSPTGFVLGTTPAFPAAIGPNEGANQVSVGPNGHFYLSVTNPNVVVEIDRSGALIATYGGPTSGQAFTEQPNVMAFDSGGRLYVTQGPRRGDRPGVLVFDVDGQLLGGFGPLGGGKGELGFPWGLIVRDDGIYVADPGGIPEVGLSSLLRKFEPIAFP